MSGNNDAGRGWVWFFWLAAIFNFAIGAAAMLGPTPTVDTRLVAVLVFAFGIIYAVTARDPNRYASVLWAGVFGKVAVVALMVAAGLDDESYGTTAIVLALDLHQEVRHRSLDRDVKGRDRLIRHHDLRCARKGAGNAHALLLAARHFHAAFSDHGHETRRLGLTDLHPEPVPFHQADDLGPVEERAEVLGVELPKAEVPVLDVV